MAKEELKQKQEHEEHEGQLWHVVKLDDGWYTLKVHVDGYVSLKVGGNVVYNGVQPPPPPKP